MSTRVLKIVIRNGKAKAATATGPSKDAQQTGSVPAASAPSSSASEQRRKLLDGYPDPSASADAIVSCIRAAIEEASALPCVWAELAIPDSLLLASKARRDAKRLREGPIEAAAGRLGAGPACKKAARSEQAAVELSPCAQQAASRPQDAAPTQQQPAVSAHPACVLPSRHRPVSCSEEPAGPAAKGDAAAQHAQPGPGSSTSDDQATMTVFPSPAQEEAGHRASPAEEASARPVVQQQQTEQHPQRPAAACQAGYCPMLPLSCLDSPGCSSAALSLNTVTPFDLHAPKQSRRPADRVDDDFLASIMKKAKDAKYAADKQRGSPSAPWSVDALCKYVQSAIIFMEACEYILRAAKERNSRLLKTKASTVQSLYASTAKLLSYTANAAESALGNDLSKDALRILTERLCAMCHMREAVHTQGRFAEAAAKAQQLSSRFNHSHQSLASLDGSSHAAGDADMVHGQPSPNDSTNSSQEVVVQGSKAAQPSAAAAARQPQLQQQQQQQQQSETIQRLMDQARQVSRFSELMRRSTLGFQTFLERPDFRNSQEAKLVSMHIAVVSMDFGMVDGFRLLSHATRALAHISAMSVAAH